VKSTALFAVVPWWVSWPLVLLVAGWFVWLAASALWWDRRPWREPGRIASTFTVILYVGTVVALGAIALALAAVLAAMFWVGVAALTESEVLATVIAVLVGLVVFGGVVIPLVGPVASHQMSRWRER
jgi:hypothetical protein